MSKRVTQKDIANATGYALITVSKALRDKKDIAEQTKKTIREAAARLGYVKNYNATNLRLGSTRTIALVISDIINPLFAIIVRDAELYARKRGYTVIVMNTAENIEYELAAIRTAISMNVDGVLLFPCQQDSGTMDILKAHNIPCVLMGRQFRRKLHAAVVFDDLKGGYLATDFLLSRGYRRILMLNAPLYISSAARRYEGYLKAHRDRGIRPDSGLAINCTSRIDGCADAIRPLAGKRFDAVFAFNDLLAFKAIHTLRELDMPVPERVGIVGFDDIMSVVPFPFPLTTISVPTLEIAHQAVDMLIDMLKSGSITKEQRVLDVSLIVRASTR
jgi:LacI family transcriptional regulator